jgi:hypothetical protein
MDGLFASPAIEHLNQSRGHFFLPDTMPIPSRDSLRGALTDARRLAGEEKHLHEWLGISHSSATARNRMDRFSRLFEIQHYWRILRQRHAAAIRGNAGRAETAIGQFLGLSAESIHRDLGEIRSRLGKDWPDRLWPV